MISKLHTSKVKFNFLFSSNHVQVVVVLERIRSIPCRIWKTIMLRMLSIISFRSLCKVIAMQMLILIIIQRKWFLFFKKKIETRIGGASKTISFKDQRLFDFVQSFMHLFDFAGAIDMDFFLEMESTICLK